MATKEKEVKKSVKEEYLALQEKIGEMEPGDEGYEKAIKDLKTLSKEYYSERVTVKLPRPRPGEDKRLFVGVNGIGYSIERGVDVEVPRSVAEVIERSEAQADANYEAREALSKAFTDDPRSK